MEDDDAQAPAYVLRPDMIIYATADNPQPIPRRPRRDGTPAWAPSYPSFALWTATQVAPQVAAAAPARRSRKRARVDGTGDEEAEAALLGRLQQVPGRSRSGDECAVCLNGFRADETLRAMPCSHAFHHHCIAQWLRRNAVCPLCRHRLPNAVEEEDEEEEEEEEEEEVAPEEEEEEVEWVDGAIGEGS